MPGLLLLLRSPATWGVLAVLLLVGMVTQYRRAVSAERQAAFMAQGLKAAYEHPATKSRTDEKKTIRTSGTLVVKGTGTVKTDALGNTEISFTGELATATTSQTDVEVKTSSESVPVLPSPPGNPGRLIWAGWADGPMLGAGLRVYRQLHAAGGVRQRDDTGQIRPVVWGMIRF